MYGLITSIMYNSPTPNEAVGYMTEHLAVIEKHGFSPETILDVGAAHGHFTNMCHVWWPEAKVTAVECNEKDKYFLDNVDAEVVYACVGAKEEEKTFYIASDDEVGGGSSFYKEFTDGFVEPSTETKQITTLDKLFPDQTFDLIKMDIQGAELEALKGGAELVKRAKYLLLELSFVEYNKGAPLIDDIFPVTRGLGFRLCSTFGPDNGVHRWGSQAIQVDGLFVNEALTSMFTFHAG